MKKLSIFAGMAAGALIGLFTSIPDGVGLKVVMMSIGALAGTMIGGIIARIGRKGRALKHNDDAFAGFGLTPEDIAQNYWRDKGRPPLTSPLEPEHGHHQFDPENF